MARSLLNSSATDNYLLSMNFEKEKYMNRFKSLVAVFAFALLVLSLPVIASAQWRDNNNRRNDDDYYGNNRSNRNLNSTIKNLRNHSREFARRLDRELDRSRIDGTRREDQINSLASDFVRATERLDNEYRNSRDYNNSQDEANRVLQIGSQLDRALGRRNVNYNIQNDWNRVREDLRTLSNAYGGNYNNNRRGRNNRDDDYDDDDDYYGNDNNRNNRNNRNRNGDWRNRIPFPLPF